MARLVHVLVLQLLLAFKALTATDVFVEEEHEAVLTCDKVQVGQDRCDTTAWLYSNPKISNTGEEFITLGKLRPDSRFKDKVTLTENCSLIIKNMQIQQHGFYMCKQYDESRREVSEASHWLSVVSLTEHVDSVEVRLNCYVSSPRSCKAVQVNLLYNGTRVETDHTSATVRSYLCGTTVSFRPEYFGTKRSELFSCEISLSLRNKRYLYKLRDKPTEKPNDTESIDDKRGGGASTAFSETPRGDERTSNRPINTCITPRGTTERIYKDWWWWTVPVAVAALTVTAVILIKRRKKKEILHENNTLEPATLTVETEPEDDVSYASVSYTRKNESTPEPGLSEDETVTYSSVNTPASHKINPLYASVGKH